jgi:uncharacterized protein YkwD
MFVQRSAITYLTALACMQTLCSCVELGEEGTSAPLSVSTSEKQPDLSTLAKLIVEKTNAFRQSQGLAEVKIDAKLAETAQYFADYLARTEKFAHDADSNQPADRAKQHGYDFCIIAENIAYEYSSQGFSSAELADKFVEGWKHSPEHRKNMIEPDVTDTGVAVAHSENGSYYAVQMFGRPHSERIRFAIVNQTDTGIEYEIDQHSFSLPPLTTRSHEQCRPADLIFHWPTAAKEPVTTLRPKNGETLTIAQDEASGFHVERQ